MATKSILKNIHIETEPEIEAFVEVLEKASEHSGNDDRINQLVAEMTEEDIKKMKGDTYDLYKDDKESNANSL